MSYENAPKGLYGRIKGSDAVKSINNVISSGWGVAILSLCTILSFLFSLELYFYTLIVVYALYVCIFADDLMPLMPLFVLGYVSPSTQNNPGVSKESIFYGATGVYLICIVSVVVIALLLRIGLDKNMGYKKLFTQKRSLLSGMLLLGAAYMLSGIGSEKYLEVFERNLLFSFIQFASIFLLYFIFTATVDWNKATTHYFAWIGVFVGIVVTVELVYAYLTQGFGPGGSINHSVYLGWGISNNIGCMIMLGIPFSFYLSTKYERSAPFILLGIIFLIGVLFTGSRASSLTAIAILPICYIYAFKKAYSKVEYSLFSILLVLVAVGGVVFFNGEIANLFKSIPDIFTFTDDGIKFGDSGRFGIYLDGLRAFINAPLFGQTFYPLGYAVYDFATIESFSAFFPPRWHNTIIQILASCGTVGIITYSVHRIQTINLFVKKRNTAKNFIAIAIFALLVNSLLDCHMFNVGPVFLYSMALAFAEFAKADESVIYDI